MRARLREIPALLRTPEGRRKIRGGAEHLARPVTQPIAGLYRRTVLRRTRIVAVVGSFGKTTTRRIVAAALGDLERDHRKRPASAILAIPAGHPYAVFEIGIDSKGQMAPMAKMLAPDIAVVTTVGSEHLRSMGSLETTRHEKAYMVRALRPGGLAVLNGDDPNVMWMASQTRENVITFGMGDGNDVRASGVTLDWPHGLTFAIHARGQTRRLRTRFVGRHFVLSFLAAAAAATEQGIGLDEFASRVEAVSPVHGRLHIRRLDNGAVLLCDYLKSTHETMHAALDALAEIPARRRIVVFGDVSEPRGTPAEVYGGLGERIGRIAQKAIFLGWRFRRYRAGAVRGGMPNSAVVDAGESVAAATAALRGDLGPGDVVLIKGRAEQRLDRIALALEGRRVACALETCWLKEPRCNECSMLERGWEGLKPAT
ncbi:MAG: UDP-N-acetylmuramoyl-tripeptide--D-alanyl-D-alanine ligase [Bryobacteraceae bacterium]|nr:UDP-N-acetylmuramoyl-tripeptide--D-alanyl-D-alanine ligase [Bryobacteraceae bacterium]